EAVNIVQSLSLHTLSDSIEGVNAIIRAHNDKTAKFDETKKQASVKLKNHYLSSIYDEIKTLEADIASLARETKTVDSEIITIQNRITENTAKISSEHKACEVLNEKLAIFLGHKELSFVPHIQPETDGNGNKKETIMGYRIMRGDKPALCLS